MLAELRQKSQVTIPKEIITKLGLSEGDKLDIFEQDFKMRDFVFRSISPVNSDDHIHSSILYPFAKSILVFSREMINKLNNPK